MEKQKPALTDQTDPWKYIEVDTSKFPYDIQQQFWLAHIAGGELGGKLVMELGTFLETMELYQIIKITEI